MKDAVVLFRTLQGYSAQYAQWIAEELHCSCHEIAHTEPQHTGYARVLIFCGGVYNGRINGLPFLTRDIGDHVGKKIIVCGVGLSDPNDPEAMAHIVEKNHLLEMKTPIDFYFFRSGISPSKLKSIDKWSYALITHRLKRKDPAKMGMYEKAMYDSLQGPLDFSDKESIRGVLQYAQASGRNPVKIR